jgi:hypothetical protein
MPQRLLVLLQNSMGSLRRRRYRLKRQHLRPSGMNYQRHWQFRSWFSPIGLLSKQKSASLVPLRGPIRPGDSLSGETAAFAAYADCCPIPLQRCDRETGRRRPSPLRPTFSEAPLGGAANFPTDACKATARAASPLIRLSQPNSTPFRLPFCVSFSPSGEIANTYARPLIVNARLSVFSRGVVMVSVYPGIEASIPL